MKPEILLIEPVMQELEAKLDQAYMVHRLAKAADRQALIGSVAPSVRAIVTGGGTGVSNDVVDALPKLEIIAINGVGTDAVDLEHARAKGVRVTNTPGVLTDDVADLGIALMLAASRQLCVGDRFVREGRWAQKEGLPLARKVTGKRLGIIGMGRIGRAIARRAEGFRMVIAYTDLREVDDDLPFEFVPDLVQLARQSDFLMVAASGGAQSQEIINRAVLDALGAKGILVNVARGSIVDEAALVAALTEGSLGGAALDVFVDEPSVPEALFKLDNVVLQPHRASATIETRVAMGELVVRNLAAYFAGKDLPTPVV
ncbi:MAG: 2-hydroxyacid dehydrogenase [Acetobacteraceae bacterium]|nr:2-hydroxyacid dehydrogenase [Acetobacteraceae bacterium]